MAKKTRIVLLGAGAIGTVMAEKLCASEYDFSIVADTSRVERYKKEGILFRGKRLDLTFFTPKESQSAADIVLVALKTYALEEALKTIAPIISDKTVIVSLMNGITSERKIATIFPKSHILYGFYIGHTASRNGNDTWQDGQYLTVIGDYPSSCEEPSKTAKDIVGLLSGAGIKIEARKNMEAEIWKKFAVNVCLNQTTAYFGCTYGEITGDKRIFFDSLAEEIQKVAVAEKILGAENYREYIKQVLGTMSPGDRSSMAQDTLAGRRTEVEDFAGEVIRIALRHGIDVPANKEVYSSMKQSDGQLTK